MDRSIISCSTAYYWTSRSISFVESPHMDLKVHNQLFYDHFSKNGSPGQTTMLTRSASKFCVEPWSLFSNISHHEPKTIGETPNLVSWPECRPEFPDDGDDGDDDDAPTIFQSGLSPIPWRTGMKYPVREYLTSISSGTQSIS